MSKQSSETLEKLKNEAKFKLAESTEQLKRELQEKHIKVSYLA